MAGYRRGATTLFRNPVRGVQRRVPGLDMLPAVGVPEVRHYECVCVYAAHTVFLALYRV